jgi:hypothetical protein
VNDKDRDEMQRSLAKLLGLTKYNKYPDGAMQVLIQVYPNDVETVNRSGNLEELEQPARGIYGAWEAHGTQEPRPSYTVVSERAAEQLGDDAAKRSKVFSEYLATLAAPEYVITHNSDEGPIRIYPEVKGFRVKYLGDRLLTPQEARTLLTSPVAAQWPRLVFKELRVPVVGHTYQVTEGMNDKRGPYSLVEVPLPSSRVKSFNDRRPFPAEAWELPEKREKARDNEALRRELKAPGGHWKIVPYPGEDGRTHRVLVKPKSVLGKLHDIVSNLIRRYPWEEPDAVWFVLTGETAQVAPFTWQFRGFSSGIGEDSFGYGFVTLKIEPWVDPKLVWKVYTDIQRGLRKGRRNRRLGSQSLKLLRIVNERVNVAELSRAGRREEGPGLVAAWDSENPDDAFDGKTKEFWKAYDRARRAVVSPTYEWRAESDKPSEKPPKAKHLKVVGTDQHGFPIFAGKWYLLHPREEGEEGDSYTGTFDSREEALADPRSENSEPLRSKELVSRLAEREKKRAEKRTEKRANN